MLFRCALPAKALVVVLFGILMLTASHVFALSEGGILDGAQDHRDRALGLELKVPKSWKAVSSETTLLNGERSSSVRLSQKYENQSRLSTAVDIRATSLYGLTGIPNRLRSKLSEADIVNLYLHAAQKTVNGFKITALRRETLAGKSVYTIETSEFTDDRYTALSTLRFLFVDDRIYLIDAWYFTPQQKDKKDLLSAAVATVKFVK